MDVSHHEGIIRNGPCLASRSSETHTIHTHGTSGCDPAHWELLLPHVDIVLLCVKSSDPAKYKKITQSHDERPYHTMLAFLVGSEVSNLLGFSVLEFFSGFQIFRF